MNTYRFRFVGFVAALLLGAFASDAFAFNNPPPTVAVVEYHNTILDHYFLTANQEEMKVIDAGGAGPGWMRTGRAFEAYAYVNTFCSGCVPIARFYGTPGLGPNSHFYTENPAEAAILQRPGTGWTLENASAFAAFPLDAGGACPAFGTVAVRRLYNGRFMFNDSNHRYVTRESDRAAMVAAGWADEGVHFCVLNALELPLKNYAIDAPLEGNILPSAQCEDESLRVGACIAINNLPVPGTPIPIGSFSLNDQYRFVNLTSLVSETAYVPFIGGAETADGPFLQGPADESSGNGTQLDSRYGIHVDTRGKALNQASSINPLYQFHTRPEDGDARFFPWREDPAGEHELSIRSVVQVLKTVARTPGSHFQGHPTLEFIDTRSGHHLYFTVGVYSPFADDGSDYLAPDVGTGKVIVGTTHRASTPYGRSLGSSSLHTPSGFVGNMGGIFDYRMDRIEFGRVLAAARRIDPALSSDPNDYLIDNFHFNNEVGGDGEIGLNVSLSLRVMRR
jgi:hypothetical protein